MARRIEYLDFLKAVAIFTVLLGHSTEQISADLFWDHPIWSFLYSFHMPLFMFLCGFFFRSSLNKPFGKMLGVKFRQLGIPSITAFAMTAIIMVCMGTDSLFDLCSLSFAGFMNSVWFLKCVLFCYIVMYPLCKWLKNDLVAGAVATLAVIFIPGTEIVNFNFMLPMFCLGMICGNHLDTIERYRKILTAVSVAVFFVLLFFWSGRMTVYMVPTHIIDISSGQFDMDNLCLTVYRLAIGIFGSMTFFLLAEPVWSVIQGCRLSGMLSGVGTATLGIYFLQTFLLEIFIHSLHLFIPMPWSCVAAPLIAILELAVCYLLVLLIRRTRVLRLLMLGEK